MSGKIQWSELVMLYHSDWNLGMNNMYHYPISDEINLFVHLSYIPLKPSPTQKHHI